MEEEAAASFKVCWKEVKHYLNLQKSGMRNLTWFLTYVHTYKIKILRQDVNPPHNPTWASLPKSRHRV